MEKQIISKVVELHNDIELPESIFTGLREQIIKEQKIKNIDFDEKDATNIKQIDEIARRLATMELVQDKIIKKEKIEIEDYDYENFADDFLLKYSEFNQNLTKDIIVSQIKANEELKRNILRKKYVDFLLDFTKTIEIDYDDYINNNSNDDNL
jgi:FKBP-type peptidyl-prolyl cis-trans isomerase (trigger factor)